MSSTNLLVGRLGEVAVPESDGLLTSHGLDDVFGQPVAGDDIRVQNADTSGSECSHCEFAMARHAKLPNEKDVQRHTERTRHREGDWNSAAGQR